MPTRADLDHMHRYPANLTSRDLERAAMERGWALDHQTGSHAIYRHENFGERLVIPVNVKKSGTKRSIIDTMKRQEARYGR